MSSVNLPLCSYCQEQQVKTINNRYCSRKCSSKATAKDNALKRKKTCMERYGVEHHWLDKNIIDKKKNTFLQKYGAENPLSSKAVREKIKKTNIEKYGVENPMQNESIKLKVIKTNLEKYGVENVYQAEEIKEKIKQSNLDRYGVEHNSQSPQVIMNRKINNLKKYGVEHTLQVSEIRNRIKRTNINKYGTPYPLLNSEIKQKAKNTLFQKYGTSIPKHVHITEKQMTLLNDYNYMYDLYIIKGMTTREIGSLLDVSYTMVNNYLKHHEIPLSSNIKQSSFEREIIEFIRNNEQSAIKENDRTIIKPLELDIVIPDKKLAIECNGDYWHSIGIERISTPNYHQNKTNLVESRGYQLLHIREWEWNNKQEIIKSIILSKLGKIKNKIYARKCKISLVDKNVAKEFYTNNHIQGYAYAKYHYGLYYQDELIFMCSFSKSSRIKGSTELIRMATKLNTQVIGGASKLIKHFIENNNIDELYSYANRDYSNGKVYESLGFEFIKNTGPSYEYYDGKNFISRFKFQKHKHNIPKEITEKEYFLKQGYRIYYNSGNKLYKLN